MYARRVWSVQMNPGWPPGEHQMNGRARRTQAILEYLAAHPGAGREEIRGQPAHDASGTTVWRALKRLVAWRCPASGALADAAHKAFRNIDAPT